MTLLVRLGDTHRPIRQNGYGFLNNQNSTFVFQKVAKEVGNYASMDGCHVPMFRSRRLLDVSKNSRSFRWHGVSRGSVLSFAIACQTYECHS